MPRPGRWTALGSKPSSDPPDGKGGIGRSPGAEGGALKDQLPYQPGPAVPAAKTGNGLSQRLWVQAPLPTSSGRRPCGGAGQDFSKPGKTVHQLLRSGPGNVQPHCGRHVQGSEKGVAAAESDSFNESE